MSITNPITVTVNAIAKVLPRINQDNYGSTYRLKEADTEYELVIRHSYEGKPGPSQYERHNVDFKMTKFVGDTRTPVVYQSYTVMRNPRSYDPVETTRITKALAVWVNTEASDLSAWVN
jgi:hypothetical protein